MSRKTPKKSRPRTNSTESAVIDATGSPAKPKRRRWRLSLMILGAGAIVGIFAVVMSYSAEAGSVTVLNATDVPIANLKIEDAKGTLEIPQVDPHSSGGGVMSTRKIEGMLRIRYSLKDPDRPGDDSFNRVIYRVPPEGLRSLTFSLSEPAKSPLFREVRLEISSVSNFSVRGMFDDLTHGRFPGRRSIGNSLSHTDRRLYVPPPAEKKG